MDPVAHWRIIASRSEPDLALDEAALVIAAQANPELDVGGQLRRLDELAASLSEAGVASLCRGLFGELGLRGDTKHYDDPRNSYLDQVLNRRLGIPISLSVLLIEIGRRQGLVLEGVGMPGHFLVRDPNEPAYLIDAFAGGQRLDRSACERLLQAVAGPGAALAPGMLRGVSKWEILARMLANLARSFERRADRESLAWVSYFRANVPVLPAEERSSVATRLGELGWIVEAADLLAALAEEGGVEEPLAQTLRRRSVALRARLN